MGGERGTALPPVGLKSTKVRSQVKIKLLRGTESDNSGIPVASWTTQIEYFEQNFFDVIVAQHSRALTKMGQGK
jgi:hypothetical protein